MENEEIIAGETEVDTQRLIEETSSTQGRRRTAGNTAADAHMRVGEECPLLSDNIPGEQQPQDDYVAFETGSRPAWRRASVSDSHSLLCLNHLASGCD